MTRTHLLVFAAALVIPLGAVAGTPGTMTPTLDDRFVRAFGDVEDGEFCGDHQDFRQDPVPDFSFFDGTVGAGAGGFATQTSSVGTDQLSGSGGASGASDLCWGIGISNYDVTFTLSGWATLALTGTIDAQDLAFGFAETTARLTRDAEVLYEEVTDPFLGAVPLSYSETLPPGTYRLFLNGNGDIWIDSSWSFTLDADPAAAPVPALGSIALTTLVVLLAGAGGAATRRPSLTGRL